MKTRTGNLFKRNGIYYVRWRVNIKLFMRSTGEQAEPDHVVFASNVGPALVTPDGWKVRYLTPVRRFQLFYLPDGGIAPQADQFHRRHGPLDVRRKLHAGAHRGNDSRRTGWLGVHGTAGRRRLTQPSLGLRQSTLPSVSERKSLPLAADMPSKTAGASRAVSERTLPSAVEMIRSLAPSSPAAAFSFL
jgi:hypothetical protein